MQAEPGRKYWGVLLITIGVGLAAAGLTFWFAWGFPETTAINQVILGIVVHVLFGYIVVMSGITIYRSDLAVEEALVAAKWCFGGFAFMSGLVLWARLPNLTGSGPSLEMFYELVVVGSVGAAAGVLIGLNRGQAVQNARLVEERGDQRETLAFLLTLLRHDTQNDLTAISGYVDILEDNVDEEGREYLDDIDRRAESMRTLFGTAGTIIESETDRQTTEPIDIEAVLREQIQHVESVDGVSVETDLKTGLTVEADKLIDELFSNVFENAVAHNQTENLTISVRTRRERKYATIVVEDDGEGIPASIREEIFQPEVRTKDSNGDGLGLYLVWKLTDSYDGEIAVSDVDPSGTRFTIRLPAA